MANRTGKNGGGRYAERPDPTEAEIVARCREVREDGFGDRPPWSERLYEVRSGHDESPTEWTAPVVDTGGMAALEDRFFRDDGDFEGSVT